MKTIVAVSKNWEIGFDGDMLFELKKDMQFFKEQTSGKVVVMGRKTLESFKNGKPLPNRTNIVLSRSVLTQNGIVQCKNLQQLAEVLKQYNSDDVFNIGGSEVYRLLLPFCSEVLVTKVDAVHGAADSFFPNLDKAENWVLAEEGPLLEDGAHHIQICRYVNTAPKDILMAKD